MKKTAMSGFLNLLVPKKGLEPPHPCEYVDLNHARLPIPPLRHYGLQAARPSVAQTIILQAASLLSNQVLHRTVISAEFLYTVPFESHACTTTLCKPLAIGTVVSSIPIDEAKVFKLYTALLST
jgi:hypothetical protein